MAFGGVAVAEVIDDDADGVVEWLLTAALPGVDATAPQHLANPAATVPLFSGGAGKHLPAGALIEEIDVQRHPQISCASRPSRNVMSPMTAAGILDAALARGMIEP